MVCDFCSYPVNSSDAYYLVIDVNNTVYVPTDDDNELNMLHRMKLLYFQDKSCDNSRPKRWK